MTKALFRKITSLEVTITFCTSILCFSNSSVGLGILMLLLSIIIASIDNQDVIDKYNREGYEIK